MRFHELIWPENRGGRAARETTSGLLYIIIVYVINYNTNHTTISCFPTTRRRAAAALCTRSSVSAPGVFFFFFFPRTTVPNKTQTARYQRDLRLLFSRANGMTTIAFYPPDFFGITRISALYERDKIRSAGNETGVLLCRSELSGNNVT